MPENKDPKKILGALLDDSVPLEHRKEYLAHLLHEGKVGDFVAKMLFEAAAKASGEVIYDKKVKELAALIAEMQAGPLRSGMFLEIVKTNGAPGRAKVVLQDGEVAFTSVPDAELAKSLKRGDLVFLEAQGRALLGRDPSGISVGEEARLERPLDDQRIEVTIDDRETKIFWASEQLAEQIAAGEVEAGARLLVEPRRYMALEAIPAPDGMSNYRYLERRPVPEVSIERDIGSPPPYLDELTEHLRTEMTIPDLGRRYQLRRSRTKLLTGVSGTGKTFSIYGFWRRMYELMSECTGVPVDELPQRVLWLRVADVVSKWYGDTERHLNRYYDEAEQLADETFVCPDGREIALPVLCVAEEIDALARARGTGEPITERVLTTMLDRLDCNSPRLQNRLIIFLCTTNVPGMVDSAILRRAGGTTEKFGRPSRRAFMAVLRKQLRDRPIRSDYGPQREAERHILRDVADWLYSREDQDQGQVSLSYVGNTEPDVRYRRDLLTAALSDRAVQEACTEACCLERMGAEEPGLTTEMVIEAFDRQIRSIVDQLNRDNVIHYLNIPDGMRVADVRRLEQPSVLPMELERVG